jgi:drug/metabolite transporter (DMT)-like permease
LALPAFAANSLLCRLALGEGSIDAASFTSLRLVSGALLLWAFASLSGRSAPSPGQGGWVAAAMLFLYAACFSFAYLSLGVGTGALILFGAVQVTMIAGAHREGQSPNPLEWLGLVLALAGLVYLVSPGLGAPTPFGAALMALAGIAWGIYSLRGRGSRNPIGDTAASFARSVPLALVLSLGTLPGLHTNPLGALLAVLSGALASGLGYVIWYAALAGLSATRAAAVQLAVPVLAAAGGVAFLDETPTMRLLVSSLAILGGIGIVVWGRAGPRTLRRAADHGSGSAAAGTVMPQGLGPPRE